MIVHARVDERLVHGQVATAWSNMLKADRLYVVNDDAWQNEIVKGALELSKPAGKKMTISSIRRAIVNFNDNRYATERVFVITQTLTDMKELINGLNPKVGLKSFNIGNISKHEGSVQVKQSVNLAPSDIVIIEELTTQGIEIVAQMVPSEARNSILTYLPK